MKFSKRLLGTMFVATFLASCGSNPLKDADKPEVVYNEGVRLLEDEDYIEADDFFKEVRRRFPQSRFAVMAELKSADLEFAQDNFIESAAAYGVFVELYPNHNEAPYALYQKALSYYNAAPENIARDQASAKDATVAAQQLITRYKSSKFAKKGADLLIRSRLKLAEKEAYVARFYEKKELLKPALIRWRGLQQGFGDVAKDSSGEKLLKEADDHISRLTKELGH